MVYSINVSTTKNTIQSSAKHTKIYLSRGVITKWDIFFPIGSEGSTRFRVTRGSDEILPRNSNGYIAGNEANFSFPEHYFLREAPYILDIYSWNLDTGFDHEFLLYISIIPFRALYPFSRYYAEVEREEELIGLQR